MPGARSARVGDSRAACRSRSPPTRASTTVRATLAASGLPAVFDLVFSPVEGRRPKPAPDVYLAACEALGVAPAEAVAFEDSPPGCAAARAAGMFVIAVPSDGHPRARGRPRARLAARPRPGGPRLVSPSARRLRARQAARRARCVRGRRRARRGRPPRRRRAAHVRARRRRRGHARRRLRGRRRAARRGRCARRARAPAAAPRSATAATARSWSRRPRPSASALLAPRERDPRRTGSAGLADLLRAALDRGATHILVGARRLGDGRRRPRDAGRPGRARARRHGRGAARRARRSISRPRARSSPASS